MGLLSFEDAAGNTYQPTPASVTQFEANSSLKISDSQMGIILGKSIEPETNENLNYQLHFEEFSAYFFCKRCRINDSRKLGC